MTLLLSNSHMKVMKENNQVRQSRARQWIVILQLKIISTRQSRRKVHIEWSKWDLRRLLLSEYPSVRWLRWSPVPGRLVAEEHGQSSESTSGRGWDDETPLKKGQRSAKMEDIAQWRWIMPDWITIKSTTVIGLVENRFQWLHYQVPSNRHYLPQSRRVCKLS